MAYVAYPSLTNPDEVLAAMVSYITSLGYTITQPLVDDMNIYDRASTDGKKFCFQNRTQDYFILLRSVNGTQVFGTTNDSAMDIANPVKNVNYKGIAMTVSEGYANDARWYNQYNVPKARGGIQVYGVFMPIDDTKGYTYTLYCNNIANPSDTIIFTLKKEDDTYRQVTHLAYCDINKYDTWDGGAMFTGSCGYTNMANGINCWNHTQTADSSILPIFSSGTTTNTFLRIDIDEAPLPARGTILWASSGTDNLTGKKLSLPIRTGENMNGKIPHYYYLQSKGRLDSGMNVNTLNAITIDMPIFAAVMVDPDILDNYAAVGNVTGIYFVSLLNMQTNCVYEISYPESGKLNQVFPVCGKRRGAYGFDGIAIQQFANT